MSGVLAYGGREPGEYIGVTLTCGCDFSLWYAFPTSVTAGLMPSLSMFS